MAITASFLPGTRVLSVFGDAASNRITASRNVAGNILINGGAVAVVGGNPTVANTDLIQLFGQGGDDTITVDETNGPMPAAQLFGGNGSDTLTGGSGMTCSSGKAETTRSLAKVATISCSVATATMCSPAAPATTRCSARRATTA